MGAISPRPADPVSTGLLRPFGQINSQMMSTDTEGTSESASTTDAESDPAESPGERPKPILPSGWTSIEDSAPEVGTSVIVAAWKCGRTETRARFEATYTGDGAFDRKSIGFPIVTSRADAPIFYRVTHWAPLPTLPEKLEEYPEQKNGSGRATEPIEERTSHLG